MLKDIEVKRITLGELPTLLFYQLIHKYHVEQWDFVIMFDEKDQVLYVNNIISEEDTQKFLKIASWSRPGINDTDCPIAFERDYVYGTYGWKIWSILLSAYVSRQRAMEKERTQEKLKEIIPLIEREIEVTIDGDLPDIFDGRLAAGVSNAGREKDRGRDMHGCITGSDVKYVFYLGYLMGSGKIKNEKAEVKQDE